MTHGDPLETAVWQGDRHLSVLEQALRDWQRAPAADLAELDADADKLRVLDQLLFRFTKLQDAMGTRLVPATLAALSEPFEDWAMIDRLSRLEKLGFLDVEAWLHWREIRNQLSHEYPERPETRFAALAAAVTAAGELAQAYRDWRHRLAARNGPA
ncbi:hypothetical protein [uncultured Thiohalocapsa sp.]|uniref:hypothetical protein n=1 Tax=uncultured Thiohalocapsa sp. TaxID=768990 RepID=UPI0025F4A3B9|nr:hypothetical protein [uncultured Thiohalocapsa sp.]